MTTWSNTLFYIAFLGQIFLISHYFSGKLLARMRYVLEAYPPDLYPKLYPRPVEHYRLAHRAFELASRFVLALGLLILLAVMFWVDHSTFADDGFISEAWPAAYGIIQFIPLMAVEFSEFGHLKLMRKANTSSIRKAELRRRSLFDFVSPALLGAAIALFLGSVLFDYYVHDFRIALDGDATQRTIVFTITNLLLAAVGAWNLFGRKQDPHQSAEDRDRRVKAALTSLIYVSMAMSVYSFTASADDLYNLDFIDALLMSIYFQVIVALSLGHMLHSVRPEDIDFDVYRNDAMATGP